MSVSRSLSLRSPALKLAAYGMVLIALLAGGAVVGAAVGPDPSTPAASHDEASMATPPSTVPMSSMSMPPVPAGLAIAQDGYRFQLATTVVDAGTPSELRFVITGPDGDPVTAFDVAHDKQLHLVIVSRDLATYAARPSRARRLGHVDGHRPGVAGRVVPGVRRLRAHRSHRLDAGSRPQRPRRLRTATSTRALERRDRRRLRGHVRRHARRRRRFGAHGHGQPQRRPGHRPRPVPRRARASRRHP